MSAPSSATLAELNSPETVRPEVMAFKPYVAGLSIDEIKERYGLDSVIKLASNENPLGTSPLVQNTLHHKAGMAFRYAQAGNPRLVQAIANFHAVSPEQIVVGNGSDEIIDLLIRVRAAPQKHNIVAFRPCFSIYTLQSQLCGVEFRQVPLQENFHFDWESFLAATDDQTAIAFVTTPDNPSGWCPPVAELEYVAKALPPSCLFVIDEAYMDFCENEAEHSLLSRLAEFPNVAILRTFSKSRGLAGLRLGYGILPPTLADYVRRVRLPFSVNILAEEAGLAALADATFHAETLRVTREGREYLTNELTALGCYVLPSSANFIMLKPPVDSAWLFEALLSRGLIIRPLKSYDLADYVRISIGNMEENKILIATCADLFANAYYAQKN